MRQLSLQRKSRFAAYSLVQTMVAASIMMTILGAVYTSSTALLGSMKTAENYSVTQLMAVDYLTLDLRRCQSYAFTTSGTTLTLPLTLQLPQYYGSDGKTPNLAQRTLVTTSNKHNKKDHKVFSARYYYFYGTLGTTVQVRYYLLNGTLYRKEDGTVTNGVLTAGSLPARAVGYNIASVI